MIISTRKRINKPGVVADILRDILTHEDEIDRNKEHFWTIGLNSSNVIVYIELVSLGLVDKSLVHPRETFRLAIQKGISSIILAHNHPSDTIIPSGCDKDITEWLKKAGDIIGIQILDHVIIGESGYYSFHDEKIL